MKVKRIIGITLSVSLLSYLIIVLIITNFTGTGETYQSGMIEDLPQGPSYSEYDVGLKKDQLAPDFTLENLAGETVQLSDYRGKKVFLNFWATWCGPCEIEMPHMQDYYADHKDAENVEIIAVNMTKREASPGQVQKFTDSHGLTFPVVLDTEGKVEKMYKIISYPSTYLINEEGLIVQAFIGSINDENEIKKLVDSIQ